MTGFYLKEKRHAGETSSLKRILEKYIEKSRLWQFLLFFFFFFYSQEQFCTFPSEGNVCSVERGQEEGRHAVFFV